MVCKLYLNKVVYKMSQLIPFLVLKPQPHQEMHSLFPTLNGICLVTSFPQNNVIDIKVC